MSDAAGSWAPVGSSWEVSSRNWSARAGSPTASVSSTWPVTVPPACPIRPVTPSRSCTSAPATTSATVCPASSPRTAAGPTREANSSAARSCAASASRSADSRVTCTPRSSRWLDTAESTRSETPLAPSTTPMASARNTAAIDTA